MRTLIWVTAQKEMFHKYDNAPKEVEFLKNLHRHIFKFKVSIDVKHNDREIEFFMFQRFVIKSIDEMEKTLTIRSCEAMADALGKLIQLKYNRNLKIEVSEDGENGCQCFIPQS